MLVIRGKVDEWRRERLNTYLIHCSLVEDKNRVSMFEALPLPFDDELKEEGITDGKETVEQAMDNYNKAMEYFNTYDPLNIKNGG